ncbi:hypothetical protein [Pontibacter anaerobius]|uniref:Outer membrane protein beta-barrel domain-containing protein n=1 Tax=Pontibacter anaerobius TaxID=2993940 RepID=A0ABT3RF42_9BACT|nr:hypothetical protein [Pontibacter anaerobius]MCX2740034.1 hypothetical protein [Pontibacter anaerobius]
MLSIYKITLKYSALPVLLLVANWAQGQKYPGTFKARNAYYLEVGGNSDTYSFNYDRILFQRYIFKAGLRAGIGTNLFFQEAEPGVYPIVPLEAMGMLGGTQNHVEFGLGYTRRFTDHPDLMQNMYFTRIGFRYQDPRGGLLVRLAVTPFVSPENKSDTPGMAVVPRFGLSVGRSF